jgi:hypothetical protein
MIVYLLDGKEKLTCGFAEYEGRDPKLCGCPAVAQVWKGKVSLCKEHALYLMDMVVTTPRRSRRDASFVSDKAFRSIIEGK